MLDPLGATGTPLAGTNGVRANKFDSYKGDESQLLSPMARCNGAGEDNLRLQTGSRGVVGSTRAGGS